jgi:hypothetical protein
MGFEEFIIEQGLFEKIEGEWKGAENYSSVYLKYVKLDGGASFYNVYDPHQELRRGKSYNLKDREVTMELGVMHRTLPMSMQRDINNNYWKYKKK